MRKLGSLTTARARVRGGDVILVMGLDVYVLSQVEGGRIDRNREAWKLMGLSKCSCR